MVQMAVKEVIIGKVEDIAFEEHYLEARRLERRLYTDEEVAKLPEVPHTHPHSGEWQLRAKSLKRVISYIHHWKPGSLVEVGCGNGWFCRQLCEEVPKVIGVDINLMELEQAVRCVPEADFVYHDLRLEPLALDEPVDGIIFQASLQYFGDLKPLWSHCKEMLKPDGELHIIDTPLYFKEGVKAAADRSKQYYSELGVEEMDASYTHHSWEDMPEHTVHYKPPGRWRQKLVKDIPFPWISIKTSDL